MMLSPCSDRRCTSDCARPNPVVFYFIFKPSCLCRCWFNVVFLPRSTWKALSVKHSQCLKSFPDPWLCKLIHAERHFCEASFKSDQLAGSTPHSLIYLKIARAIKLHRLLGICSIPNYCILHGLQTMATCCSLMTSAINSGCFSMSKNPRPSDWNCCLAKERGEFKELKEALEIPVL